MNVKIAIIGTQGTGKKTLVSKLQKELHRRGKTVNVVKEVARSCPFGINEQGTFLSQRWIFHEQLTKELEAEYKDPDIILYNRAILDNLCYMERISENHKPFPVVEYLQMVEIARYWSQKYDYIIYMPLNLKWLKEDGTRSTDPDFAKDIDTRISKMINDFGLKYTRYRKNFSIPTFCDKFSTRKKVKIINRRK